MGVNKLTKEQLLNSLQEALKTEESTIPLYVRHINSALFLSGFEDETQKRIKQILDKLHRESTAHSKIYKKMIGRIEGDERNVY